MKAEARLANESDAEKFIEFEKGTIDNLFDPDIANYPSLRTIEVDIGGEPALFVPFHPVLVVESLGHRPGITPKENAYALRTAHTALEKIAKDYGIAEAWWMCSDEGLIKFAQRHGYEVVQTKVLRKKL